MRGAMDLVRRRCETTRRVFVALLIASVLCGGTAACAREAPLPRVALSQDSNPIQATREAIDGARDSVHAVVYKFDEPGLLESLAAARRRGVVVRLVVDGEEAAKSKSRVSAAIEAGAVVRLWPRDLGKLHAKFTVIDSKRALAGSFNWTRAALQKNVELVLDLADAETAARLITLFERLWAQAAPAAAP